MSGSTEGKSLSVTACKAFPPTSSGLSPGLSAGHVRLLNLLSHEMATALSVTAGDMLPGKTVVVSPLPAIVTPKSALRDGDVAASQEGAEALGIGIAFAATPYPFQGELLLDRRIGYALLEHALGGDRLTSPPVRQDTPLERRLLGKLAAPLLTACEQAWSRFAPVRFSPLEAAGPSHRGQACLCPFQVSAGEVEGRLCLSLPLPEATPLLAQLTVEAWVSGGTTEVPRGPDDAASPTGEGTSLLSALQDSRVPLRAVLGTRLLALGELLRLAAGDLVFLPGLEEEAVTVHIADRPKFVGQVRHHRGRLVVELLDHP
jgi:flagellar motor switch protein FliM